MGKYLILSPVAFAHGVSMPGETVELSPEGAADLLEIRVIQPIEPEPVPEPKPTKRGRG
jgi:hypothetical protein